MLWPQLIIIGGGISNVADQFLPLIELRTPIVPAQLRNHAGIIGGPTRTARVVTVMQA